MYLLTLLSPMSMPSLSDSPWMRGAPQVGFSLGCWLPRGHQGDCQPSYEPGDHIKVEFEGQDEMPGEWMWVIVQGRDDQKQIVYGNRN